MVLLILYFVPFDLLTPQDSFRAVADQLFVSPVVRTLVFTKASREEVCSANSTPVEYHNLMLLGSRHRKQKQATAYIKRKEKSVDVTTSLQSYDGAEHQRFMIFSYFATCMIFSYFAT